MTALILAAALLAACGGPDTVDSTASETLEPIIEEPVVVEPVYTFDGTSTETVLTAARAENYRVELEFLTDPDFTYSSAFSDTSPPMPFKSDNLRVYLRDGRYSVRVVGPEGEVPTTFGSADTPLKVMLEDRCGTTRLMLDDREVYSGPSAGRLGGLILGGGFKQRNWAGQFTVADVEVLDIEC